MGALEGKRILVTGAATGIGRATTIRVASEGAAVAALDLNDEGAASTLKTVADAGGRAQYWHVDVTREQEVRSAVDGAADWLGGGIDVLLHMAGVLKGAHLDVTELTEEIWDSVIDINLKGSFLVVKHVASRMIRQGSGVIVLTSSGAGVLGPGSSYAYSSSKGGTHGLALALAEHLSGHGIRVNDILPGSLNTPLKVAATEESLRNTGDKEAYDRTIGSMSSPDGVAAVLAFLASDDASYIRGSIRTI
jgi:NAD(P)-dependent dehydrogenase (short-subunit alcohol dehydrogenase family)